jgi:hypothetical protein
MPQPLCLNGEGSESDQHEANCSYLVRTGSPREKGERLGLRLILSLAEAADKLEPLDPSLAVALDYRARLDLAVLLPRHASGCE